MSTPDGGPAFPVPAPDSATDGRTHVGGMTLRDWFAGQAIGPLMASDGFEKVFYAQCPGLDIGELPSFAATTAYQIADAMLRAREAKP